MIKTTEKIKLSQGNVIEIINSTEQINYQKALKYMEKRVAKISEGQANEAIWLLEHPPVYTMGSSAQESDLLNTQKISVHRTNRGGQITYHGPGQRVVYLMLDLRKLFSPKDPDLRCYVKILEQSMIDCLLLFKVNGKRLDGYPGIWVDDSKGELKKIAAIGVRVKKWISYHGVAINISPNLQYFNGIIPCGIRDYGVTSLKDLKIFVERENFDITYKECLIDNLKNAPYL